MVEIDLCECGHWEGDHFGPCHNCKYHYDNYGDMKEHKVSKCKAYKKKYTAELGYIDESRLHIGERGGLQISLAFDFGGTHQGFGGWSLGGEKSMTSKPVIYGLMDFFDVQELKDIIGKYAYAIREGRSGKIVGIKKNAYDAKEDHSNISVWAFTNYFKDDD